MVLKYTRSWHKQATYFSDIWYTYASIININKHWVLWCYLLHDDVHSRYRIHMVHGRSPDLMGSSPSSVACGLCEPRSAVILAPASAWQSSPYLSFPGPRWVRQQCGSPKKTKTLGLELTIISLFGGINACENNELSKCQLHINHWVLYKDKVILFLFFLVVSHNNSLKKAQSFQTELGKFWNTTVGIVWCFLSTTLFWKQKYWKYCIKTQAGWISRPISRPEWFGSGWIRFWTFGCGDKINLSKLRNGKQTEHFQITEWFRGYRQMSMGTKDAIIKLVFSPCPKVQFLFSIALLWSAIPACLAAIVIKRPTYFCEFPLKILLKNDYVSTSAHFLIILIHSKVKTIKKLLMINYNISL